jgi:PEP-CTERM motif
MRRVVVIALLAMALPMAVWADNISLTNQRGTISMSDAGITSKGSQLTSFNGIQAPPGKSLGTVSYSTGALVSGSVAAGGIFSSAGSTFDVVGKGNFGEPKGPIFTGAFTGNIDWTLVSQSGSKLVYTLSGSLAGQLYNGVMVTGTTTQTITTHPGQLNQGIGHITLGSTTLTTPEPGTLGLLGTGLLGIAGMFRRKKS